ncbi:glycosyltransferase family 4 protein [Bacillus alkalicellulosilyticus]|uniref:glycosyltransferase family 4 protein n=1 Tax=Alkalihalobacterium alkalicellulosilyticum TaxID=1912214 RepID=UPI000998A68D|nr:glycosyltransferase family 1 protein [Bacillus alkalicellulosilyticus]
MRIALFTDTYIPQVNGVAKTLQRLVNHFELRNVDYKLFVPTEMPDPFPSHIHSFFSLPFFLYPECRLAVPNPFLIRQQMAEFKPDLLHITTPFNIGLSGLHYGKKLNIPMVGSYHTHFDHYLQYYKLTIMSEMLWTYLRWFYGHFEETFVPSTETKIHLVKKGFNNIQLWTRGVDCSLFQPYQNTNLLPTTAQDKYKLLYVGRMAPEKDLATLCQVIRKMPEQLKDNIHWVFVGDGPMLPEMKAEFSKNVTFTGYLTGTALAEMYASADLFVFPSTTETFGNVVLESLASGTPAIVANEGGVQEIVTHNQTGMVCQSKNPQAFIQAIEMILGNESKRRQMSLEARSYAKTQSWEAIFDNLLLHYEQTIYQTKKTVRMA